AVDGHGEPARLAAPPPVAPQRREAHRGAQLPGACALAAREAERLPEPRVGGGDVGVLAEQRELASQAIELRLDPALFRAADARHGLVERLEAELGTIRAAVGFG